MVLYKTNSWLYFHFILRMLKECIPDSTFELFFFVLYPSLTCFIYNWLTLIFEGLSIFVIYLVIGLKNYWLLNSLFFTKKILNFHEWPIKSVVQISLVCLFEFLLSSNQSYWFIGHSITTWTWWGGSKNGKILST